MHLLTFFPHLQNVHGWLNLGLENVLELLVMEIYPIIIQVTINEKNGKKIRWVLLFSGRMAACHSGNALV